MKIIYSILIIMLFLHIPWPRAISADMNTYPDKHKNSNTATTDKNQTVRHQKNNLNPEIIRLDAHTIKVGQVVVDHQSKTVLLEGEVNMTEGLVEYFACTPTGKLHESVLTVMAEPYHIKIALLLVGLKPGDNPIPFQGAPNTPVGDPLIIKVTWKSNGGIVEHQARDLIFNIKTQKPEKNLKWVFSDSLFVEGKYMAQEEGSIIAVFHDPYAMIDHTFGGGSDDTLFYANEKILPPKGTKVEIWISGEKNHTRRNHGSKK